MPHAVEITVAPLDAQWRVTAVVDGQPAREVVRHFAYSEEAVDYADTLRNLFTLNGAQVRVVQHGPSGRLST